MIDGVDYTKLHNAHEVVLRVELLRDRVIEKFTSPYKNPAILEIGLGSGDTTKMLLNFYDDVTCVDIEQTRIDQVARYILPRSAHFVCADAKTVTFRRQFDHIFLIGLLEHCPEDEAVLSNVRQYLKPSGRIHVLVNNVGSIHRRLGVQMGDIKTIDELSPSDIRQGHHRIYSPNTLYAHMSKASLRVDYVDEHYMKPLPSSMMNQLPLEISRAFVELGRKFPQFAAYTYLEAVAA